MKYQELGRSGLRVSEFGLGTMAFGPGVGFMAGLSADEPTARRMLDLALDRGVNWLDTADVYQDGASEAMVGRWLRERGARDRIIVATKVGGAVGPGPGDAGLSRRHLVAACEASLRRLGTDRVDLYQVHWPDAATPLEQTLEALTQLRDQGKIRAAGCSNFPAWLLCKALWVADAHDLIRFEALQPQYNLLLRHIEREILPLCRDQGLGVIPWSPLAGGLLTGKHAAIPAAHARLRMWQRRYGEGRRESVSQIIEIVSEISDSRRCSQAAVALRWLADRRGISGCVLGARDPQQLEQNLTATELVLTADETAALDRASAMPDDYPTTMMNRQLSGGPFWD